MIETRVFISFTDRERATLKDTATMLLDMAIATEDVSDEFSEKFDAAYELLRELLDLEGEGFDLA